VTPAGGHPAEGPSDGEGLREAEGRSSAAVAESLPLAVVLAGGLSRRMGSPKAVVPLGGHPLIAWPLAAAQAAGLRAVVVAKPGSHLPPLDVAVWEEPAAPSHPLTGLVAALERAGRPIVALACDMPFVSPALIQRLAAAQGLAVPRGEAFPARYEPAALAALREGLAREVAVRSVLADAAPVEADPDELFGVNDPQALEEATRRAAALPPDRRPPAR
jgi:molybdopterin-guanine dinucleotide biosynthesis protein A